LRSSEASLAPAVEVVRFDVRVQFGKSSAVFNVDSYENLVCQLQEKWKSLKFSHFAVVTLSAPGTQPVVVTDTSLATLAAAQPQQRAGSRRPSAVVLTLKVHVHTRGFSYYGLHKDEALELLNLKHNAVVEDPEAFPLDTRVSEDIYVTQASICQQEIARRAAIFLAGASINSTEYTMREFISPVLIAAVTCASTVVSKLSMLCEKAVIGRKAQGPVDYVVYAGLLCLLLGEAKLKDMAAGVFQNYVQQLAAVESLANSMITASTVGVKRTRAYGTAIKAARLLGTSGVVSTGRLYKFSRCTFSVGSEESNIVSSPEYELTLNPANSETALAAQLDQIKVLLKIIVHLIITQHQVATDTQDARRTLLEGADDLQEPPLGVLDAIETLASQDLTEAQLVREIDDAMVQEEEEQEE
jgi:hypothetical protein